MDIKELNKVINEVLEKETRKLIREQVSDIDHVIDSIKSFQTLSGLVNKISDIQDIGNGDFGIIVNINNVSPEELVDCCGGISLEEALKNLMQGIHHDLEDNGMGKNFDVDVDTQGDENSLGLKIKITANKDELSGDNEMKENTKDTNPTVDKKKDIILGSKNISNENNKSIEVAEEELDEVKKWIQKAFKKIEKKGTEGKCTGKKFGSSSCPKGTKAYNMAKNLRKINKESVEKRVVTLSEDQMAELLTKIIKEAAETKDPMTDRVTREAGKQNAEALAAVEKKIKDYLSFKGNDNPEFPNQIGMGDEKAARQNTKDQDQEVDDNRGRGPQDLDYDTDGVDDNGEPAKKFRDRAKKALVGDSTMGNPPDAANAIKTDVGEKISKNAERRRENLRKEPIYPKEAVPVKTKPEKEPLRPVNEEIERMKQMAFYNKKTQ